MHKKKETIVTPNSTSILIEYITIREKETIVTFLHNLLIQ